MIKGSGPSGRITVSDVESSVVTVAPPAFNTTPIMQVAPTPPARTVVTQGMF